MNDIIKIQEIGLDKLNNAEFVAFMTRFDELVSKAGTLEGEEEKSALGFAITELEAFGSDLNLIKDLVDQSRISDYTAQLQGIDKERDEWVVSLFAEVRSGKTSKVASRREAAISLYNIIKPYTGCYRLPGMQETSKIEGLLIDLKKPENTSLVTTLGLNEIIVGLEETNGEYAILMAKRTEENAAARLEETKSVRARMIKLYDYMSTMAFVQSVAHPTEVTAAFVSSLNALISEVNTRYNQRIAQLNRKKDEQPA